ncbi:EVE domain-containing protein [Propionivibrio sp.]|uniref:EVE domain-containing protein n=1 Tax=Propionivibrio sp. TaxID=2212460 RepID=UPI00260FF2DB|nr:EVE domain-containing protein [Propionivibrio sp.]
MTFWLMKSEPAAFAWQQLMTDKRAKWDGVRNHQAANNMKAMQLGDEAFFYHSNEGLEIVGIMRITKRAYPDGSDPTGRFVMVDVAPVRALKHSVTLKTIKADPLLRGMALVRQSRLSVSPVTAAEWRRVLELSEA